MTDFNPTVDDAAGGDDPTLLQTALANYPHLLDAPHPQKHQRMPIHHAAEKGKTWAIEALVAAGSRAIDMATDEGWTPMHLAAEHGHVGVIEILVKLGSQSIDSPQRWFFNGQSTPIERSATPLHRAIEKRHVESVRTLLRLGSQAKDLIRCRLSPDQVALNAHMMMFGGPNATDLSNANGKTPLAMAIQQGSTEIVKILLEFGADLAETLDHTHDKQFVGLCAELSDFPALRLVKFYHPKTRTLSFRNAKLSDEAAATLFLSNWKSCAKIDFRGNPELTELPGSLAQLDPNRPIEFRFDCGGNWNAFEEEIIGKESREIIEHTQLKVQGASVRVNELKLMAVGFAAVGKTTLVRRLKDGDYNHPLSTDGVDMGELKLHAESGEILRIVVWDFAGQPLYRLTHLLFLRDPGLCLLLFKLTDDVSKSVEQLRFWCETLRSFVSKQSRVLLVGTHLDRCADQALAQQLAEQVQKQLQQFLRFPEPPVLVSCAAGQEYEQTITALQVAIFQTALSIDNRAPACIEIARKALLPAATTNIPLLTSSAAHELIIDYAAKVEHTRLTRDAELRQTCLRALQSLGSVMLLEKRGAITHVVVNPQWVALLLATVVTTRHTWIVRGQVTFGTLSSQVWRGNRRFPVEIHNILVDILKQLQVLFALEKRQTASYSPAQVCFLPCSLPEQRPHIRFPAFARFGDLGEHESGGHSTLRRLFKMSERGSCVPLGVLPEVVVQLMTFPNSKILEIWQQGGVFRIKLPSSSSGEVHNEVTVSVTKLATDTIEVIVQSTRTHLSAEWIRDVSTMVENQLHDVYHIRFEVCAPCGAHEDSCYVPLDLLRASVFQRVQPRCLPLGAHTVRVDRVAPDLLFADLGYQEFVHMWSTIRLLSQLGHGACGKVMLGQLASSSAASAPSSATTSRVAVKLLEDSERDAAGNDLIKNYREFQHEAYLMSLLKHPNIVRFVGVCFPSEHPRADHEMSPALIMEVVEGDTLYRSLCDAVGVFKVCSIATEIMKAVGAFNLQNSMYEANPSKHPFPAPLPPFHGVADAAVGRINCILDQRILGRASRDGCASEPIVSKLSELRQQLFTQLELFYKGPITRPLRREIDGTLDAIQSLNAPIAGLLVPMKWPIRLKVATDAAQGLMYLHSRSPPVVHRDFKSLNLFLMRSLDALDLASIDWNQPLAKVGDFGLSIRMLGAKEFKVGDSHNLNEVNPTWAAPEVLSKEAYSIEADVYGLGITMWELLMREHPFTNVNLPLLAKHVIEGGRPLIPAEISEAHDDDILQEYLLLMKRCWHQDPEQRPPVCEAYSSLRELCRRAAPEVFATLPELSEAPSTAEQASRSDKNAATRRSNREVARIDSMTLLEDESSSSIRCLQAVGEDSVWVGLRCGKVVVVQFGKSRDRLPRNGAPLCCNETDRHEQSVSAMCFNAAQQMTVWTGSKDGRIFVWSSLIEDLEGAKQRCYLKTKFVVAHSNAVQLSRFKGKPLYCVLRNGRLHCYPDEHVGPPCFELDLCQGNLVVTAHDGKLDLTAKETQLILQSQVCSDEADDDPVHVWERTVAHLSQLAMSEHGAMVRLALSSKRSRSEFITALEATDEATWCLSLSTLVEWQLLETQHGLHSQLRLEPARQLRFDMSDPRFSTARLCSVCCLVWAAPYVLWLGTANTIAFIDLTPPTNEARAESSLSSSSGLSSADDQVLSSLQSPCQQCFNVHDGRCSEFLTQRSSSSPMSPGDGSSAAALDCVECGKPPGIFRRRGACQGCRGALCSRCSEKLRFCSGCGSSSRSSQALFAAADHAPRLTLQWPRSQSASQHAEAVRLLTLVESKASPSGFEVWSYASYEHILVWRTPLRAHSPTSDEINAEQSPEAPVFLERVQVRSDIDGQVLTCMKQVGSQVWAGTSHGLILGWDVETRAPLARQPFDQQQLQLPTDSRPITDIVLLLGAKRQDTKMAISGHELTLRSFSFAKESSSSKRKD